MENNKNKKPVVVYGEKEIYMKASFIACSFTGIPYVPIDINIPRNRVESIINQINPSFIIGDLESNYRTINKKKYL
jgi:D-alanine--poly(phosphoribitol) ligase subunit 1